MRRLFLLNDGTVAMITRPTAYRTPETMRDTLDEANPAWPVGQTERRLLFVDIPIERQTGAFFVGTFVRHPKLHARFLTRNQARNLPQEVSSREKLGRLCRI